MTEPTAILAATDLTAGSHGVIPRAVMLARRSGASLHVVHVVPADGVAAPQGAAHRQAERILSNAIERAAVDLDQAPSAMVVEGVPGGAIVEAGERHHADAYVLGFHKDQALSPKSLGSCMQYVLLHTSADVLLTVHRQIESYRQVVIAWDGEKSLARALTGLAHYAPDAALTVFRDVPLKTGRDEAEASLRRRLVTDGFDPQSVRPVVTSGSVTAGLRDTIETAGADLLVMPTRGSQLGTLGYIASEILAGRYCDTLCLHRDDRS